MTNRTTSPWRLLIRLFALIVMLLIVAGGASLGFVVADDTYGRIVAIEFAVGLFLAVLDATLILVKIVRRFGGRARFVRVSLIASTVIVLAVSAVFFVEFPNATRRALATVPSRYPSVPPLLGDAAQRLAVALGAENVPTKAAASSSAGPKPGSSNSANAPRPKSTSSDPAPDAGPARFSAGDSTYMEPGDACDAPADVADLVAAFRPDALRASVEGLAKRRYPAGLPFLEAQDDLTLAVWMKGAKTGFDGVVARFDAAVHEGSHIWGPKHSSLTSVTYPVRADLTIETRRLFNFNRSEIFPLVAEEGKDTYATTYLSGASGAQGFNTLLDEYNAYTHSLAARFCTRDLLDSNQRVSARDGILAMMYYVELYLRLAREKHPNDYADIVKDPGHRRLIVTVWNRAELWLRRSAPFPSLGIHDRALETLAYGADGLAEIARIRDADRADAGPR